MRHALLVLASFFGVLAACATDSEDPARTLAPSEPAAKPEAGVASLPPDDAGGIADAAHDATTMPAGCTSTMAILAGDETGSFAMKWKGGTWGAPQSLGGSIASTPSLVFDGTSYLGVMRSSTNAVTFTRATSAVWSPVAPVAAAMSASPPALAVAGGAVHIAYRGTDSKFYHGVFSNGAWDAATDPVGGAGAQSFGPSAPTLTPWGAGFFLAQTGQDANVYAQQWDATWSAARLVSGAMDATPSTSPRTVSLLSGEALVVFSQSDTVLEYGVIRASGVSNAGVVYDEVAGPLAATPSTVSVAPLPGGRAVMVYMTGDAKPFYTIYTPGAPPVDASTLWSKPLPFPAAASLLSMPELAPGVCGDDAVATYAVSGGGVHVMSFKAGVWSAPTSVGTTSAKLATLATQP